MAKKAASPKKPAAKKTAKSAPVKPAAPKPAAKAKAVVAKPTALVSKPTPKAEAAPKPTKEAKVAAPVKAAQVADSSEKIKIDRDNMTEEQVKWAEMYNKYKDTQATTYDMKSSFKAGAPLQHKVLGWGWIVSNENDRLEVLFKDGKRMLISNYRG